MAKIQACKQWFAALLLAALIVGLGGCASPAKPTLKLAANPWQGSELNANVAKLLLQEQLGYPVEIVAMDEYVQWAALAKGEISASLEVWPSGHLQDIAQYIDGEKTVANLGLLGVVGEIGWYVPTYVVEQYPELKTWEGFKDPQKAALFKTPATGDLGQFITGDPSWVQYDSDIIRNLGLKLQVVQSGSEQATLAAVDAAYQSQAPLLFYFWSPHAIHAQYQLTKIKLPDYSDACYAQASQGSVACSYPPEVLFKIAGPGLKKQAPEAYQFLKNFAYTNADQIAMMAQMSAEGKTAEAAARAWIEKNESRWKTWLPAR